MTQNKYKAYMSGTTDTFKLEVINEVELVMKVDGVMCNVAANRVHAKCARWPAAPVLTAG